MPDNEFAYYAWAPSMATWSPWAKPVLFAQDQTIDDDHPLLLEPPVDTHWPVDWGADLTRGTAIVLDLPGVLSVNLALALAATGYRPVPLFNACPEPRGETGLVNVRPIVRTLFQRASGLYDLRLPFNAPPVFMLDAGRNTPLVVAAPGMFDNRSISLPTDFPSALFLQSHGITRIILVQPTYAPPRADLSHTLLRWQEAGLPILSYALDLPAIPIPIVIKRPSAFRLVWYNLLAKFGFKANPLGGFGGHLPMPSNG